MKRKLEIFALIVAVSAVLTLLFFLVTSWNRCVIPFEPILWIRIPEIIMGIISVIVLSWMLGKKWSEEC